MPEKWPEQQPNISKGEKIEEMKVSETRDIKNIRSVEDVEKELSPEVIEKIMDKVQDIDARGTAHTSLSRLKERDPLDNQENLKRFFEQGLLGSKSSDNETTKERWYSEIRKEKLLTKVYFNIVGRSYTLRSGMKNEYFLEKQRKEMGKSYWAHDGGVYLIIDLASFMEDIPGIMDQQRSKHFKAVQREVDFGKDGLPLVDSEYGFSLPYRVAPKSFRGVVLDWKDWNKLSRWLKCENEKEGKILESEIVTSLQERMNKVVSIMKNVYVHNNKKDSLIPVYDIRGNLLWPKQMSYEEVRKFVTEKGAKSEEK